jgi:glutamyl-tRNA reductase
LAELPTALTEADLVFSATSAGQPIITPDLLAEVMRLRGDAPLTLIDLAVPRDIDPAVASLPGVRCFDMDDLRANLDDALSLRQQAVPQVDAIIAEEVADWQQQVQALVVKPHIVALRQKAEHIRQKELARALRFLGDVDPQTRDQLEHLTQSLVNSLLHEPTVNLKALAAEPDVDDIVVTFRTLFKLDDECSSPVTVRTHSSQAGH